MRRFGIGQSLGRVEDRRFLEGQGRYTDDFVFDGQLHAVFLRAPVAHANLLEIDVSAALEMEGVHLVLTHQDVTAEGVSPLKCAASLPGMITRNRPVLAEGKLRYVGEPVAVIVAESVGLARAAAEAVMVDYDPLDAVSDGDAALSPSAPLLYEDIAQNRAFVWETGDEAAVEKAFAGAAHISQVKIRNNRVAPTSMEPRAINALYDQDKGFEVTLGSQGVAGLQGELATNLGVEPEKMRVMTPDVGGGFGMKAFNYPEYVAVLMAARRLGRPVKWTSDRSDAFLSDLHGRDLSSTAELALDNDGHILAYRIRTVANMGAYLSSFGPAIATLAPLQVVTGPYHIPVVHQHVTGVYSNSAPIDAYRGAGRPEAAYLLERLMHKAAMDLGLGQDEIRRRNFVASSDMPYKNATGAVYDSGDFLRTMTDAMKRADWQGFEARRAESSARGLLRGIGMAYYVECTIGAPTEDIALHFTSDGRLEVAVGTQSTGQGHETAYAQILGDRLGIDPSLIDIRQGDTRRKNTGGGTSGSRSLQMVGNACVDAGDKVITQGTWLMAHLFDCAPEAVSFKDGHFEVDATNKRVTVMELAELGQRAPDLPQEFTGGLDLVATYTKPASTFPNGCHICEVEVDPETGVTRVVAYVVVDDFGKIINPMLVEGQVHGGVVQGLGQALGETVIYDGDGQLLSGSFMDYGIPRADEVPFIDFSYNEILCQTNPLGLKGCGEAGTIGACPSAMIAIIEALAPLNVSHLDMPATPLRVWESVRAARMAG